MRLKLINLTKRFTSLKRSIVAVNGINLEIQDKEFFVLLGPSGCGKSTVLNLIAGLEKPTNGEIQFGNRLVASKKQKVFLTPKERNVAMVFQTYALYPHLNVFENIAFPLRIAKVKSNKIKESVNKVAETLEISDLLDAKPAELSGGQRQRVAIARAIVRQPDIFLLDEPLSNLDAQLRTRARTELKNLQRKLGITTIYVSHDQVEAMTLGDRIAVLNKGKLEQIGSSNELYEKPINPFVATFIGSPPMNLIDTNFIEENGIYYIFLANKKIRMPERLKSDFVKLNKNICIFGIRPEHIKISPTQKDTTLKAQILFVEPLGKELLLQISIDKNKLFILTPEKSLKEGDIINIEFDIDKAHIFSVK
jgi:multiple sugar transport system ATP-binding protein